MYTAKYGRRPNSRFYKVIFCLFTILWIAFIFYNSGKTGAVSGEVSQSVTSAITGQPVTPSDELLETLVRKAGHLGEYALLGVLVTLAACQWRPPSFKILLAALAFVHLVAIADECFQTLIPGRAGLVSDVFIDLAGALLGMAPALFILKKRSKRRGRFPES